MSDVYFKKIKAIEKILAEIDLNDLVLVLSKKEEDLFLLVYNAEKLPAKPSPETIRMQLLAMLEPGECMEYDGPVLGFPELDIVIPDIPLHGDAFYSLEHLFQKYNRLETMYETAFRLAGRLYKRFRELDEVRRENQKESWYFRIIKLALIKLLWEKRKAIRGNLAGFILNTANEKFLNALSENMQMLYIDKLPDWRDMTPGPGQWIAAFEETGLLNKNLGKTNPHFIELRPVFHRAGLTQALKEHILNLAICCRQEGERSGDSDLQHTAYALGVEAWTIDEDVEDLVAVLPHRDFETFTRAGRALRIFRGIILNNPGDPGEKDPRYSLRDIVENRIAMDEISQDYRAALVSFPILSPFLQGLIPGPVIDLGPVLQKAGHEVELASTLLLLSWDLLKAAPVNWLSINAGAEAIAGMALRAAYLYSFIDPGHPKMRQGRHSLFLEQSYRHLDECLVNEEKRSGGNPLSSYYRLLKEWYGAFISDDLPRSLGNVIQAARDFLEKSSRESTLEQEIKTAERLQRIAADLLYLHPVALAGEDREDAVYARVFKRIEYINDAADSVNRAPELSPDFKALMLEYGRLHGRWNKLQEHSQDQRQLSENLNRLYTDYKRLVQTACLPAHELKILQWACGEDMQRIRRRLDNLDVGAVIRIKLLNPQLVFDSLEWLHLEVENVGGDNAYDFEMELIPVGQVELPTSAAANKIASFAPIHPRRFSWQVRPLELSLNLKVLYRFNDREGKPHKGEETMAVNVVAPKDAQKRPGKNILYQAGTPVSGAEKFFGRAMELSRILRRLLGGSTQPILLRGPRRIGKTSILNQLKWLLDKRGKLQQYGFSAEEDIQIGIFRPALTSLQELKPGADYSARWFQRVFMAAAKELGVAYDEKSLDPDFDRDPAGAFRSYMSQLFKKRAQSRLLIMVDEWDTLRHSRYSHLAENLRAIMEDIDLKNINWIVSSTWTLSQESSRFGSPFYNQSDAIALKEMEWKEASDLVIVPGDKMGVTWHGDAVVALLELTGRRPYLTQLMCARMMDYLYEQSQNRVDTQAVTIVKNRLVKETLTIGSIFGFLWGGIHPVAAGRSEENKEGDKARLHWLGQFILWILDRHSAEGISAIQIQEEIKTTFKDHGLTFPDPNFFSQEFAKQMIQLEFVFDVIVKQGDRYSFGIPLAHQWFHTVVSQQSDPVQQAYRGILQDMEEWKKESEV